jgi:hypothetical protein
MDVHNPPLFTDDDGTKYVVLATSDNDEGLHALERAMYQRLFGGKYIDHLDEVWTHHGHTSQLLIRKDLWDSRPLEAWVRHSQYASGWVDALDAC